MRIGFLIGAGCSLAIQVPDGKKTKPHIPEIVGLTKQVNANSTKSMSLCGGVRASRARWPDSGSG